jgi:hypothetical protein
MLSRIHQKLGTAGFIISIVALVAALGGGAYAASGGLSGKQKKEVEKIAKKFAGKPGAPGSTGPAGAAGAKGESGAAGSAGNQGADGKSATVTAITEGGSKCEGRAGAEVKVEGATSGSVICNGKNGGGELAPGTTETGVWSVGQLPTVEPSGTPSTAFVPITFSSPLPEGEPALTVIYRPEEEDPVTEEPGFAAPTTECPGNAEEPKAAAGFMCVYQTPNSSQQLTFLGGSNPGGLEPTAGAGRNGTILKFTYHGFARGMGAWAATARS